MSFNVGSISGNSITIDIPEKSKELGDKVLIPFQRHIEKIYKDLPWPEGMKNILVFTKCIGGRGDIAAAMKAMSLMQRICGEDLVFDWVVMNAPVDPALFITPEMASRVYCRSGIIPPFDAPVDFVVSGPADVSSGTLLVGREIQGPFYGFYEIAHKSTRDPLEVNLELFRSIFPTRIGFPMGIIPGSGVFLDQSRIQAPLSRGCCDPSYLRSIRDADLRRDILESMEVYDDASKPDFDRYSFNSGYAHSANSWGRFIDAVAIHENKKNVVIVMNHHGAYGEPSAEEFCDGILSEERLDLLKKLGYGSVTLRSKGKETLFLLSEDGHKLRNVTLILRPSFSAEDMKPLQLASERLLATGDNTAVEAWCARCKLFLYEPLSHKFPFLEQQIDLAKKIAPSVARLLVARELSDLERAASDPDLEKDTLNFCNYIAKHCSFDPIFEGGIKRSAWQYLIPELVKIEEETLDKTFKRDLIQYAADNRSKKSLTISTLPQLEQRVRKRVADHIVKSSLPPLGKDPLDIITEYASS